MINKLNTYEVYTRNPIDLSTGWDIKLLYGTREEVEALPLFDCIITINDVNVNVCEWLPSAYK